tara:strand:+ start:271 stop:408 length:138 start_codon:yes stop_codon:yes gene_type:complete
MATSKLFGTKFLPTNPKIAFNQRGDRDLIIFFVVSEAIKKTDMER